MNKKHKDTITALKTNPIYRSCGHEELSTAKQVLEDFKSIIGLATEEMYVKRFIIQAGAEFLKYYISNCLGNESTTVQEFKTDYFRIVVYNKKAYEIYLNIDKYDTEEINYFLFEYELIPLIKEFYQLKIARMVSYIDMALDKIEAEEFIRQYYKDILIKVTEKGTREEFLNRVLNDEYMQEWEKQIIRELAEKRGVGQ